MHRAVDNTLRERILQRDGRRCTVARLLGGECHPVLHVHHIIAVADGGTDDEDNLATVCQSHHPVWESLRRWLERKKLRGRRTCRHTHRTREAREICERKLNAAA